MEPNPTYAVGFERRSCSLVSNCLWRTERVMDFSFESGEFGGIVSQGVHNAGEGKPVNVPDKHFIRTLQLLQAIAESLDSAADNTRMTGLQHA